MGLTMRGRSIRGNIAVAAAVTAVGAFTPASYGVLYTSTTDWIGNASAGSSALWSTGTNWNPATAVSAGTVAAQFNGATSGTPKKLTVDITATNRNAGAVLFVNSGAAGDGFTFISATADRTISIRPDGFVNNDADTQTFNVPIKVFTTGGGGGAATIISATAGNLVFNGGQAAGTTLAAFDMNGAGALTVNGAFNTTITGVLAGTGAVNKNGAGTFTLSGTAANTINGLVTVNGGTLSLSKTAGVNAIAGALTVGDGTNAATAKLLAANQIIDSSAVTVSANATFDMNSLAETIGTLAGTGAITNNTAGLTINGSGASNFGGTIAGAGSLTKSAASTGITTLSGNNSSYAGNIIVNGGRLSVTNNGALGNAAGNTQIATGAELLFTGATVSTAEPVTINGVGGTDNGAIAGIANSTVTLSGPITLATSSQITASSGSTLTFSNANAITGTNVSLTLQGTTTTSAISGAISLGTGGLTKAQGGKWVLSGPNDYSGTTTVSAGTLLVNGTHVNAGDYTVASGATLGGTGSITLAANTNSVTVNGTFAPGASIESIDINTGDLTLGSTAITNIEIDLTGNLSDEVNVGDLLTYGGTLNVTFSGTNTSGGSWDVFDFGSFTGTFGANVNFISTPAGQTASFNEESGVVTLTAVPEPAAASVLLLGAAGMILRRRRSA
jgi:autotransporter-associated beta strand protein